MAALKIAEKDNSLQTVLSCSIKEYRDSDACVSIGLIGADRALHRAFLQAYYPPDGSISFDFVVCKFDSIPLRLKVGIQIWADGNNLGNHSPGYLHIIRSHARRCNGMLIHFDSSCRISFAAVDEYLSVIRGVVNSEAKPYFTQGLIYLIALIRKNELQQVSREEAVEFTQKHLLPDPIFLNYVPTDHSIELTEVLIRWVLGYIARSGLARVTVNEPQPLLHSICHIF